MSNRRLAAVMFADIAGYTRLMQENEALGVQTAKRFREILDGLVPEFDGEVIQYYGDGSLMIFSSAVNAIRCAREVQLETTRKPYVPLRIGIHVGDITIEGEQVYGDGVNLAARVESLGVPGAVLITERVSHDIRSHPDIELVSRGKFHFKNASHPMEVFALASPGLLIPDIKDMQGKVENGKKETGNFIQNLFKNSRFPVIGIIALLVGLSGFSLKNILFKQDKALSLTVYVHGPEGKQQILLDQQGTLIADFGNDRRTATIGEDGRTNFGEIPEKFRDQEFFLSVDAKGYRPTAKDSTYTLGGSPIYLAIESFEETIELKGQILDQDKLIPLSGARVMCEGEAARTDSLGNFSIIVPERQEGYLYKIIVNQDGYKVFEERRSPEIGSMQLYLQKVE